MTRRDLVTIHKWVGLCLGGFWLLQALSGMALTYTNFLDISAYPERLAQPVNPQDFSRAAAAVRAARPDAEVGRLMLPQRDSSLIDAYLTNASSETIRLRMSRESGRIVAEEAWSAVNTNMPALRFIYVFHHDLLSGPVGHIIVGISGLFLTVTAGIGLAIAWPRGRKWKAVLKPVPWKRSLPAYYSWHRALGVWCFSAIFVAASTGSTLVWLPEIRQATGLAVTEPAINSAALSESSALDVDRAVTLAMQAVPDGYVYLVDLPSQTHARFRIRLREPGDPREHFGTTTVYVSAYGKSLLKVSRRSDQSAGHQILDTIYALHTGEILGSGGKFIIFATGLALATLCALGYFLWFRKNPVKRNRH